MLLCLGLYVHSFDEQLWKTPIWKSSINNSLCDFHCAATPQCMPWPCHFSIPAPRHSASQTGQRMVSGFQLTESGPSQFFIVAVHQLPSTQPPGGSTRGIASSTPTWIQRIKASHCGLHGLTPQKSGAPWGAPWWSTGSGGILWFFNWWMFWQHVTNITRHIYNIYICFFSNLSFLCLSSCLISICLMIFFNVLHKLQRHHVATSVESWEV